MVQLLESQTHDQGRVFEYRPQLKIVSSWLCTGSTQEISQHYLNKLLTETKLQLRDKNNTT